MDAIFEEKLTTSMHFIATLCSGSNPLTGQETQEDTLLNNPEIIRGLFAVKEVLNELMVEALKKSAIKKAYTKKPAGPAEFPLTLLGAYRYRGDKSMTRLIKQLYEPVADPEIKMIKAQTVLNWFRVSGYLIDEFDPELRKNVTVPTAKGTELGIRTERVNNPEYGKVYVNLLFTKPAQEFVVSHMEAILNGETAESIHS